jgi:arylsulfatase A-like enzyme
MVAGAAAGGAMARLGLAGTGPAQKRAPNVVILFADDLGYGDLGCYGAPEIKTPHLDRMRAEGMLMTDFYSASPVCSPSRAALLTGCYPPRVGVTEVFFPRHETGLAGGEVTLAELLKTRGYATACIGKWHLGHRPDFLPTRHGFDRYFGIPYSNDMWVDPAAAVADNCVFREGLDLAALRDGKKRGGKVPLMRDEQVVEYPAEQSTLTQRYTDEAVDFIKANRDKPFLLYLPHTMPHIPLAASEAFRGKSDRGPYGDTVEEIDASTGRILQTLKDLGLDENTLVIFTSDNGPWNLSKGRGGSPGPLRGYKFSTYEGGVRVPCLVRWPGTVPAMSSCNAPAGTIDLLPTIAALAGAKVPGDRVIDGRDIRDLLTDKPGAGSPHETMQYWRLDDLQAIRHGDWKLRDVTDRKGKRTVELFNLRHDVAESENLADKHPRRVADLQARLAAAEKELRAHSRPLGRLAPGPDR